VDFQLTQKAKTNLDRRGRRQFLQVASLLGVGGLQAGCERVPDVAGGFVGTHPERGHLLRPMPVGVGSAGALPGISVKRTRFLIAGAGVAGLAAARALRLQGIDDVVVLDLEDEAGGNSRSMVMGGLRCPIGAHYLPVPGDQAHEVQDLLEEMGLRQRHAGRWRYDERHLCHSPQERLFFGGEWQEGLLPVNGIGKDTLLQYQAFAKLVDNLRAQSLWSIPVSRNRWGAVQMPLLGQTMAQFLAAHQLNDPHLLWYLDYCCRDDYGAGIAVVSAFAGVHYFASRHGFEAPQPHGLAPPAEVSTANDEQEGVLTWPEGMAWLTQRLAAPLGQRLLTGQVVTRISDNKHRVEVDAVHARTGERSRWEADHVIVALPVFVAARLVQNPSDLLRQAAARTRYAPWLVTNLLLDKPLFPGPGAPPSWDNVIYNPAEPQGLGYVDATHQSLHPVPQTKLITHYRALGDQPQARAQLLASDWGTLKHQVIKDLSVALPDLPYKVQEVQMTRYGHAMAMPSPGSFGAWSWQGQGRSKGAAPPAHGRLRFAHSDWAGYSVFEEAFVMGHAVGTKA
jgi:protoporphyrinogen oxidase